jgi:D-psicose/D-tagatose/L-ribulose 3-epimerase
MKIGMNMLLWTNHVTDAHYHIFEKLKSTGFEGIEIPLGDGDLTHYSKLGNRLLEMELGSTCVTSLLEETNIASPDSKIRAAGLDRLKWSIDMAAALNAEVICGPIHSAFAYFTRQPPSSDEIKWSVEMLQKAGEYAHQAGIILAPEALNRFECYLVNTMGGLKELLDAVNHQNVGAIYDTHHANMEEKNQGAAIHQIKDHLKHVHVSENDRGTPGKGAIDWDSVFTALKEVHYNGWITIEAFSTAIPEFANAINVWRNFSPPEEIYKEGYKFINERWNAA